MKIINKTLNLEELKLRPQSMIVEEAIELIHLFERKGLKFTTYQAEFGSGWGKDDIWFKRKLWEISTIVVNSAPIEGMKVLDCGGASTIFSFYLASKGCRVYTVDIDWRKQGIVENADFVSQTMGLGMHNLKVSMTQLPYEDNYFDRVFSVCVLEHLAHKEQDKAIKEMSRVLKPGGIMALTFDYGPFAHGGKYEDVRRLNKRIVIPSGLSILENSDYLENVWFGEMPGKTWGALFLTKNDYPKRLLTCLRPNSRLAAFLKSDLSVIKSMIMNMLIGLGIKNDALL